MADIDLVLAPTDCSDASARASDYAVAIAARYGAGLHLLHVVDERLALSLESGDVDPDTVATNYQEFAAAVEGKIDDTPGVSGFTYSSAAGFSSSRLSRMPGSVVLDAAEEIGADFIVLPRETPTDRPEETLGKAALYVLEYASQPVLSV